MRNKAHEGASMGEQNLPRFKAESAGGGIEAGKFLRRGKVRADAIDWAPFYGFGTGAG